jgi:hypothetical protein
MLRTRINVNKHKMRAGEPCIRVERGKEVQYGTEVLIHGPSVVVYRPATPLKCGAKSWIETFEEVEVR